MIGWLSIVMYLLTSIGALDGGILYFKALIRIFLVDCTLTCLFVFHTSVKTVTPLASSISYQSFNPHGFLRYVEAIYVNYF